jgi:hypothetical protein
VERRESNVCPVIFAENVGAIRSVDSGEESGACGDARGVANAPDDAGTSRVCSKVASLPKVAELVELVEAAIAALDAGESDVARARLRTLRAAVRATCHVADEGGV